MYYAYILYITFFYSSETMFLEYLCSSGTSITDIVKSILGV